MISLTPVLHEESATPLYQQLFVYIRDAILRSYILPGEKLPSLRSLSKSLNISITTVELAYNQLLVEGYISSRPRSGYFVSEISPGSERGFYAPLSPGSDPLLILCRKPMEIIRSMIRNVLTLRNEEVQQQDPDRLFFPASLEGDIQGEAPLRDEISIYLPGKRRSVIEIRWSSRREPSTDHPSALFQRMDIDQASFENPGYLPVKHLQR